MRRLLYIGTALATAFHYSADAYAGSGYWNNSGFSISHQFYPGLHRSYSNSYFNYAPRYYGFNRYYIGGSGSGHAGPAAEPEATPVEWAKKCGSSCLDLSGDR
jgi:hypothetical protein